MEPKMERDNFGGCMASSIASGVFAAVYNPVLNNCMMCNAAFVKIL